jgi:hypothetical protein
MENRKPHVRALQWLAQPQNQFFVLKLVKDSSTAQCKAESAFRWRTKRKCYTGICDGNVDSSQPKIHPKSVILSITTTAVVKGKKATRMRGAASDVFVALFPS